MSKYCTTHIHALRRLVLKIHVTVKLLKLSYDKMMGPRSYKGFSKRPASISRQTTVRRTEFSLTCLTKVTSTVVTTAWSLATRFSIALGGAQWGVPTRKYQYQLDPATEGSCNRSPKFNPPSWTCRVRPLPHLFPIVHWGSVALKPYSPCPTARAYLQAAPHDNGGQFRLKLLAVKQTWHRRSRIARELFRVQVWLLWTSNTLIRKTCFVCHENIM